MGEELEVHLNGAVALLGRNCVPLLKPMRLLWDMLSDLSGTDGSDNFKEIGSIDLKQVDSQVFWLALCYSQLLVDNKPKSTPEPPPAEPTADPPPAAPPTTTSKPRSKKKSSAHDGNRIRPDPSSPAVGPQVPEEEPIKTSLKGAVEEFWTKADPFLNRLLCFSLWADFVELLNPLLRRHRSRIARMPVKRLQHLYEAGDMKLTPEQLRDTACSVFGQTAFDSFRL